MKIETTTQLLPILDLSMYESYLSPDFVFSSQREELSYENKEETDFDFDEYKKAVCKLADKFIQENYAETLKKYGVLHIHCVSIHSPKFYNYDTDKGYLDLEVSDEFQFIMKGWLTGSCLVPGWEAATNEWLEENLGSCSGFVSLMPTTVKELLECDDLERCASVYLTLALLQEELLSDNDGIGSANQETFCRIVFESLSYGEYATTQCIYEPTLWKMYQHHADKLNELMWNLFYKGVIRSVDVTRVGTLNEMERFILWVTNKGYSYSDLILLANS